MRAFIAILLVATLSWTQSTAAATTSPAPLAEFTADMTTHQGFFTFYHAPAQGNYYLQIPRQSTPFIFQTSLPWGLGSNDIGLDRGQLGATRLASFHIEGNKVLLQQHNTYYRATSDNPAERASVSEAFAGSVIAGFAVVAADDQHVLVDYTPFLLSDTHGVIERLQQTEQGSYRLAADRSVIYPARSKAFPDNTELEAKITFSGEAKGQYVRSVAADPDHLTMHLHHSFIRLPDDGYQPRTFHPNSGFWAENHMDYAAPLGEPMLVQYIPRHRLQKQDPDAAVSKPVKPIIYYLDPGVPEPVRSALLDGGRWWDQAFQAIGYEDAFQVRELPADADPMDVRYNVIQWVHRSTRGWSYGASITDPRTGEIIKGHVTLGSLRVRQDMLIAQGLLAPFARQLDANTRQQLMQQVEDMALARIRQLSAHEIGHTLGIAHNFAASARDRASVMDYPHPLVSLATDHDGLTLAEAYTNELGLWDKQVIAYGYGEASPATIIERNKQLGLGFISDRDARAAGGAHPDAHLWDSGSDAVTELERVLAVRRTALQRFGLDNLPAGVPLSRLHQVLVPMYLLHRYQVEAAVKMLAGVHYDYYVTGEDTPDYRPVNAQQQRRALQQLSQTLSAEQLALPDTIKALLVPTAYGEPASRETFSGLTGLIPDPDSMAASAARFTLELMLHPERLERLQQQQQQDETIPDVRQLLSAVEQQAIAPAYQPAASSLEQRLAFEALTAIAGSYLNAQLSSTAKAPLHAFLQQQQQLWEGAAASDHRQFALAALTQLFSEQSWPVKPAPALPPGSPI
ncbi:peptidase [Pseudidiomarina salinarum]|uniref:Peptidase n=1 Tax=Pseudidiomarina salinarum TaxID=435908 RepID=A0A094JFY0_9GAMM|nr:zinc-dependent metalloprotease [Pseudidiomarina salinarum]KFZ31466.1 peptidase [Pseudidiomarina salinarum]RUO70773.1 peptidase [Pseudidiomarina salinarum]